MSRSTAGAPVSAQQRVDRLATASRGASSSTKRSPSASCSVAPSPRIASVTRKPSRPVMPTTAVGWNWTNSRSASSAPAARASSRPEPNEPGGLVVRDHSAAAPPVARIDARAPRAGGRRRRRRPSRGRRAASSAARAGRRAPRCAAPRRRRPRAGAGSGARWRCRRRARRGGRRGRPPGRARDGRGGRRRSGRRAAPGRRSARAPRRTGPRRRCGGPGRGRRTSVSCEVLRRASPPPRARRRARPAPSRRRSRRAGGAETSVTRAPCAAATRAAKSPAAPAPTTMRSRGCSGTAGTVPRRAALAPPRRRPGARHPRASGAAGADHRARGGDGAPRLVRVGARRGAARDAEQLERVHPAAHVDAIEALARRAGARSTSTPRSCPAPARRRSARRAGRSRWSTRCSARASRAASRRRGRPATTPRPPARWASASSTTSPSRRGTRRPRTALERVLVLDWDVHHGNGTNDIFHADPSRAVLLDPRVAAVPGHRTGLGRGLGARARGSRVNMPVPAGSGDAVLCSLVEHVVAPLVAARARPRWCSSRRASTRTAPTRSRCSSDRGGLRGDDGVAAAARARSSGRRSGSCSRAATRWTRWPPPWPRYCRCWAPTCRRRVDVPLHPLADEARARR